MMCVFVVCEICLGGEGGGGEGRLHLASIYVLCMYMYVTCMYVCPVYVHVCNMYMYVTTCM